MCLQGQRIRSSRWSHDHPGSPGKPDTGRRNLDTLGGMKELRTAICCHNVAQSSGRENERKFSQVGAPDALKGACPVRGGLGGIPLLKDSMDAVLLLHIIPYFRSLRRALGRPRLLTRVSAPAVGRESHPTSTPALFRERSLVDTLSMAAQHCARPAVRRPCDVRREDSAVFRHRRGAGRPCPPRWTHSRAQQP
jgi:hypothetical protein